MYTVTLKGSHYEIGYQTGKTLHDQGWTIPEYIKEKNIQFALKTRQKVKSIIPNLLEEIDGISDGGGYNRHAILTLALTIGRIPGCTAIAVTHKRTVDGKTVFARNYDAPPSCQEFGVFKTYPEDGLSHIGCCWDLLVGREDGINEAGLAIATNGVHGVYTDDPGVWDHIPVRAVLDSCENMREAVNLLRRIPHLFTKNFLMADANGDIAIVEAAQQNVAVLYPESGLGVITNHFESETMIQYNSPRREMFKTRERLRNAKAWLEEKRRLIGKGEMKRLLTDAKRGVCSDKEDFSTVWSWVAECKERSIELATGRPVTGNYNRCEF
ncbi:MAG: C45 family autoproteolytic acyltransferase/hydrolase [Candidatus Bathyarchaeia archaeon]